MPRNLNEIYGSIFQSDNGHKAVHICKYDMQILENFMEYIHFQAVFLKKNEYMKWELLWTHKT